MIMEQHHCTKYLRSAPRTNKPIEIFLPSTLGKIGCRELNIGTSVSVWANRVAIISTSMGAHNRVGH